MPSTRGAAFQLLPLLPFRTPSLTRRCTAAAAAMPLSSATPRRLRRLSATPPDLTDAGALLRAGKLVAFPTETVYGLGADATNAAAVGAIFTAKGRPSDNPLIVHVTSAEDITRHGLCARLSPLAVRLAEAFWPGPLTLVLPLHADAHLAAAVSAGLPSVAVRVPSHPVAAALLAAAGVPVAAPSANLSGRPSPTCAEHVARDLDGRIDAVVDEGAGLEKADNCGLESTVVDLTGPPAVLRPGAISIHDLEKVTGVKFTPFADVTRSASQVAKPKSPGMKYRHYAPRAPMQLVYSDIHGTVARFMAEGHRVGVLGSDDICSQFSENLHVAKVVCGKHGDTESFARELYAGLRAFDGEGPEAVLQPVDIILAVPPENVEQGIGEAVMNRLRKAAAGRHEAVQAKS